MFSSKIVNVLSVRLKNCFGVGPLIAFFTYRPTKDAKITDIKVNHT